MSDEPIDVTATGDDLPIDGELDGCGGELVPQAPTPTLALTTDVTADELVARLEIIKDAAERAMTPGVDYGVIPGTDKPTLYKPGAEKLAVLFRLDVQTEDKKLWMPERHLTVLTSAIVYHSPTRHRLGSGKGVCSTYERKYAYRKQERKCPSCGAEAVIKGKKEYGGGWLCWKKRDGCGAKFPDGDESIEGQEAAPVANPDLPDLWNTVTKMAKKRAVIDAVLLATGASAIFTQDMEDQAAPVDAEGEAEQPQQQRQATRREPSKAQRDYLERLLREANLTDPKVQGYVATFDFDKTSKAIEALKTDSGDAAQRITAAAEQWSASQPDVPADTEGLDPRDKAETADDGIPF